MCLFINYHSIKIVRPTDKNTLIISLTIKFPLKAHHWQKLPRYKSGTEEESSQTKKLPFFCHFLYMLIFWMLNLPFELGIFKCSFRFSTFAKTLVNVCTYILHTAPTEQLCQIAILKLWKWNNCSLIKSLLTKYSTVID